MDILVEKKDRIALIKLNRPEARNALSLSMRDELEQQLIEFDCDPNLLVAVITGEGTKAFCAGADLKAAPPTSSGPSAVFDRDNRSLVRDLQLSKPVIAAVNGLAFGGGFELALLCDIRIAARTASFALPEVRIGSMPGSGGTQRLPRLVGTGSALHMMLTGDRIDADEALRLGLVTHVVEADRLMPTVMEIAKRIAANAPISVRAIRKAVREGADMSLAEGLSLERTLFTMVRDTEDRLEGRHAFREKRPPVFKGR